MFEYRGIRPLFRKTSIALGLLCVLSIGAARADSPAAPTSRCAVMSAPQAKSLADVLYEQGEYQRAAECYEVAGEPARAQLAYLKAAGPNGESTARGLREERDAAQALIAQVQRAFRKDH